MSTALASPFSIVAPIPPQLDAVLTYWQDLRRGEAEIPFADDIDLAALRPTCRELLVLEVFSRPERFRLNIADIGMARGDRDQVLGRFIDEIDLPPPLDLLRAQCSATVETARPTVYRHIPCARSGEPYSRILLPAWDGGEIRMLLGAIERGRLDDD
jgi:hypothetical protein